ncbi:MAG: DUF362 domain-containing protein [Dehalococcoidia bacterium]|nr:MAG: DUF362 domain-containing protein [Dehalococcoidia bacterium]
MYDVAVVRYERPLESLREAVELAGGLESISRDSKVFIKPNFCQWYEGVSFPKYGVLTTARLIEDMVLLLKERDVTDITLVEGVVEIERKPESMLQKVARGMGLDILANRYGMKMIDVLRSPSARVTAGGVTISVNRDVLQADHLINMPVLKTHSQTVVSLGLKNLKGLLSIPSRKKCHSINPHTDLTYHLAKLLDFFSPSLTIMDGIYTLERGPLITGRAYRSNIIIASKDPYSADKVGTTLLGIGPDTVPHLTLAATNLGRTPDLSDINIRGGIDVRTALKPHLWEFEQNESGDLPMYFERAGVRGLTYPQADTTMCTYCADFIYYVIWGVLMAENRDKPFDDIEVLHGKALDPSGIHKHTLLVGQCQVKRNSKNPLINHCVNINGCPPSREGLLEAYAELGIDLPHDFLERMRTSSETYMKRYAGNPEFDESFYKIQ